MSLTKQFAIRPVNSDDIPFIYSTWLKSMRYDSDIGKSCRNGIFFVEYREVIDRILNNENTKILVACGISEPSVIYGYLVATDSSIEYCYIKDSFRRMGLARCLVVNIFSTNPRVLNNEKDALIITHLTQTARPIVQSHPQLVYNPFKLYAKDEVLTGRSPKESADG